jgi:DNA-binding response OmpR family regulator
MAIKRLRDKVEEDPSEPSAIRTVRGVGYRFDA